MVMFIPFEGAYMMFHLCSPPEPIVPQPVTQLRVPALKELEFAARQTGRMKLVKGTGDESFSRQMSLLLVALL